MKSWMAFALGLLVAAGVYIATRQSEPAPALDTAAPAPAASPAAQPQPEPPQKPRQATGRKTAEPPKQVATAEPPRAEPKPEPKPEPKAEPAPAPPPAPPPPPPPAPRVARKATITEGTVIPVRLVESLSSETNQTGDSFMATLDQPIVIDGLVIAEKGGRVEGRVSNADRGGRVKGVQVISVELVNLTTSDGQRVELQTTPFEKLGEKGVKEDAKKVGIGAGIGAAIGAIAGGGRGAAIGAAAGGAAGTGAVLATRGKPAVLSSETRLLFRLNSPVTVTEKLK